MQVTRSGGQLLVDEVIDYLAVPKLAAGADAALPDQRFESTRRPAGAGLPAQQPCLSP